MATVGVVDARFAVSVFVTDKKIDPEVVVPSEFATEIWYWPVGAACGTTKDIWLPRFEET